MQLYDLDKQNDPGFVIRALVKNDDGEKEIQYIDETPADYCFVDAQRVNPIAYKRFNGRADFDEIYETAGKHWMKVEFDHPQSKRNFVDSVPVETREADIPYIRRVMIDKDWSVDPPDPIDVLYFDIEVDPRGEFPEAEDAENQILSIACMDGEGNTRYFEDHNETQMLRDFVEFADDYYVTVGWNSENFDWPYVKNRCFEKGVRFDATRWIHLDLMCLFQNLTRESPPSDKLNDVGEYALGIEKEQTFVGSEMDVIWNWFQDGDSRLREYNEMDTKITKEIDDKYGLVNILFRVCEVSNTLPRTIIYLDRDDRPQFAGGQACDAMILQTARKMGEIQPNRGRHKDIKDFPGGYTIDPDKGLHNRIVTLDYSGMYPAIIKAFNIGPNTWHDDKSGTIDSQSGSFDHPDENQSVIAAALKDIEDMRKEFKSKRDSFERGTEEHSKWKNLDAGLKAIVNTMYGVAASIYHRYYMPGMSKNVTLNGQYLIRRTRDFCNDEHPLVEKVIYGDTDSVMVKLVDEGDLVENAKEVKEDLNIFLQSVAAEHNAIGKYLEVDIDEVFDRFYIGSKKKRYFGHVVWDGGPADTVKRTGYETERSEWPDCSKRFLKKLMDAKLFDEDVGEIIREAKTELFNGLYDHELVSAKSLNQPISEYETKLPHTRAAQMIRDEHGDDAINVGDKVPHIKYGPEKEDVAHNVGGFNVDFRMNEGYCRECDEVVYVGDHPDHDIADFPHFREQHYSFLWDKRFRKIMNRIGIHEFTQTGLSQFAKA